MTKRATDAGKNGNGSQTFEIRLRSAIRGRERWEVRAIYQRPGLAGKVQESLLAEPGIQQAEANSKTGRILIVFDPAAVRGEGGALIERVLIARLRERTAPELPPPIFSDSPLMGVMAWSEPRTKLMVRASAWTAASTVIGFLPAWGLSGLLDVQKAGVGGKSNSGKIWFMGILTAGLNALEWMIRHHQRKLWRDFASSAEHTIRTRTFAHVETLDMAFFDNQNTGQLLSILSNDVSAVGRFLETGPSNAIQQSLTVLLCLGTLTLLSPSLALMAAIPGAVVILTSRYFQKKIAPLYARFGADTGELNRLLSNCLAGIATIKSFAAEEDEARRIEAASARRRLSHDEAIEASSANGSYIHGLVYSTVSALTLTKASVSANQGSLRHKSLFTVAQLVPKLFAATSQIDDLYESYVDAALSSERILALLNAQPAIRNGIKQLNPAEVRGDIQFTNVSFSYLSGAQILQDLSLEIRPGETVGIVGATGAGKTTIIKLLLRFYDINGGQVTIDGADVRSFRLRALHEAIAFVSQDVYLFDGTVHDNIAYGRPSATREEVIEAARAAEAHEFIEQLPRGYDSEVGERGQRLSMGQRQRISIARAVIKNAPILVLDEATASIDNETEAAIHRSIEKVAVGRSMVVIAHRLSTVRNAARIYVIDKGSVAEKGTHDELLEARGLYASLWNVQTGLRAPKPSDAVIDAHRGSERESD